ncbi:MAG: hypothetical protein RML95_04590 [Anaerolineae bacterium]|nr:hypothetical protein [Anaerolineae bacterium]MDW8298594.1 hypothetical protein [Anaerolineae bacterium]
MKRLSALVVVLALLAVFTVSAPTLAQGDKISYGDTVKDSLTGSVNKVSYTFEAKRGDIAVVQLIPADRDGLIGGVLTVTDSTGAVLADSDRIISGRLGEIVAVEVRNNGEYTINVEGRSGATGDFEIALLQAEFLDLDKPVESEVSSTPEGERGRYANFYVIESRNDVEVIYEPLSGNIAPALIIFEVISGNNLAERAFLFGSIVKKGSIVIEGSRDFRLATVSIDNFGSSGRGSAQTSTFRLTLTEAK